MHIYTYIYIYIIENGSKDRERLSFYAFDGERDEYDNQLFELIDMIG
jgi:hypothetical protein